MGCRFNKDKIMIRRTHTHIVASRHGDDDLLKYVIEAYGFLLPLGETSWRDFAKLIKAHYSLDNPINMSVYCYCLERELI